MLRIMSLFVVVSLAVSSLLLSCNRQPEVLYQKKINNVTATVTSDGKSLVKGNNMLKISLVDSSGAPVSNAMVHVRFFNKPGPGRMQLDISTPASPDDGSYGFVADFMEAGEWNFEIHISRRETGEPPIDLSFKVDVQ